ncbi:MAG: hypothetical protein AB7N76_17980 [Planctomycetota bacterium]
MSPRLRGPAALLSAALALGCTGCLLPVRGGVVVRSGAYAAHRWVYYPSHDVYYCEVHRRYAYRSGGAWVYGAHLDLDLGAGVTLDVGVAEPWYHEPVWVWYGGPGVYYSPTHRYYLVPGAGGWVVQTRFHGRLGPGSRVEYRGGRPYLHHHPPGSVPAGAPRGRGHGGHPGHHGR